MLRQLQRTHIHNQKYKNHLKNGQIGIDCSAATNLLEKSAEPVLNYVRTMIDSSVHKTHMPHTHLHFGI